MPELRFSAQDAKLLGAIDEEFSGSRRPRDAYELQRSHLVLHKSDILVAALAQQRSASEIVARIRAYEFLGFEVGSDAAGVRELDSLCKTGNDLLPLLKHLKRQSGSMSHIDLSGIDILITSFQLDILSGDTLSLLMGLAPAGIHVSCDPALLDGVSLDDIDKQLLSRDFDAHAPWLSGEITPAHLVRASQELNLPILLLHDRLRRLEPLGVRLPSSIDPLRKVDIDLSLFSRDLDGCSPWIGSRAHLAHVARIARKREISMGEALGLLQELAWTGLTLPAIAPDDLDTLEREEPDLRAVVNGLDDSEGNARQVAIAAMGGSFATVARIASRLGILPDPLCAAFETLGPDAEPTMEDVTILAAFEGAPGRDPATRFRRGRSFARFQIWEPPDAELDAAIERLRPVIDHIIAEPKL
jgi:hypothetical protein